MRIPPGWLPANISGAPAIRWINIGSLPLSEPFFFQSIGKLRRSPPASECETGLSPLEGILGARPSGIIFHMTRCGSTLVANALRSAEGAVVLSEAPAIGRVMGWVGSPSRYWAELGSKIIAPLMAVFAGYQGGGSLGRVIIKTGTEGIRSLPALRNIWGKDHLPCLILVRNPVEVLASAVRRPLKQVFGWRDQLAYSRSRVPPCDVLAGGLLDCSAWAIGQFCSDALAVIDQGCRVLDYSDLTPEVVCKVAAYFNLPLSQEAFRGIGDAFRLDAKNPDRVFQGDSESKMSSGEAVRVAARKWIEGPYGELRKRAGGW
jgi:hypothetical protein